MKKLIIFFTFICITVTSNAQLHEIGVLAGGSNYIGDVGSETYINPNDIMFGAVYKRNINPRFALRGSFTYAEISANDSDSENVARQERGIYFNNTIKELAVGLEFNFFEFNISNHRTTQTPYLLLEFAAFNYSTIDRETSPGVYTTKSQTSFAIPFGLGYKTKVMDFLVLGFEARARYTFKDDLDYNYRDSSYLDFGNPNSNDWYMFTGISLTYSFGRPPCYSAPY
ncbi:DUF6089 family protein [Lutibacter sp. TH_r2]|uniref:type IX secretion system protein PorG n=1 Tax=Lutibacter sp. TH_r2 TaxID=3082083 RepID=UPI002953BD9B|nr:DUF6089 family protein [Lutibacter sp. TH_r2]MDV7187878.1 DUF6089 family protein [Lutibacter sp. TH_r2]